MAANAWAHEAHLCGILTGDEALPYPTSSPSPNLRKTEKKRKIEHLIGLELACEEIERMET